MGEDRDASAALSREAVARVEGWIAARDSDGAGTARATTRPDLLDGARSDAEGLAFTRRLLEAVVDVRDPFTAALGLRALAQELPPSLPTRDRLAMRAGGLASLGMPWAVLPAARRWLRDRVSHLVLSAPIPSSPPSSPASPSSSPSSSSGGREGRGTAFLAALRAHDADPASETLLAHLGEPVLGPAGVDREVRRLRGLAELSGVTHLAVDPARVAPGAANRSTDPDSAAAAWALDADARAGASALRPLLETARDRGTTIVLESHDFRSALLAPALLERALTGGVIGARAGLRLAAELPESRDAAETIIRMSRERLAIGAEPLELTIQLTGLGAIEQIDSVVSGHPVPTLPDDAARAQWLRLVELAARAGDAIRLVAASEDPLLLSAATLIAERHGAPAPTLQLRAGTAPALGTALLEHGFTVRQRLPVVAPKEFVGVVGPLIHLVAEAAAPGSALDRAAAFAGSRSPLEGAAGAADTEDLGVSGATGAAVDTPASPASREELPWPASALDALTGIVGAALGPFPPSRRVRSRSREWDPNEPERTRLYLPPTSTERFDTGGLTAAVLGLGRDATGQIVIEPQGEELRVPVISESGFANEPDTDATLRANREWARGLLSRAASLREATDARVDTAAIPTATAEGRSALLDAVERAAGSWRAQRVTERAARVSRLALGTASARDRLIAELAAESGAPIGVIDADVSGAIDAARYFGLVSQGLAAVRGAEFRPGGIALVSAGAGIPLAERAEAVLAALTAGSAVLLVAHPSVAGSSAALLEEWRAAGLPEHVVGLAIGAEPRGAHAEPPGDALAQAESDPHTSLAAAFAEDPRIDRALVLGLRPTARAIERHRPALRVEGRFRTLGASAIAPSAGVETAVRGAIASAFGAAAADASTARALVLIGSASRSKRLRRLLADGVRGLRVGDSAGPRGNEDSAPHTDADASDPLAFDVGPLPQAPTAAGIRALTELQSGETWLVQPEPLDEAGLLWRPGVRFGVRRDARFWSDAVGMPVIGVISAGSLGEAIALQNELGGGSTAALFSADPSDTLPWLDGAQAASLALGRPTTGGRVERRPGGGWGEAGMGVAPLAGGPNRLVTLGSWQLREGTPSSTLHLRGLEPELQAFIETTQASLDYAAFDRLRRAALTDALTWRTSLGRVRDAIGLGVERNLLRHWPVSTHVRLAEGGSLLELARVLAAGMLVAAPMTVSTGGVLPAEVTQFLSRQGIALALERDEAWLERIAVAGPGAGAERVRLIGGDPVRTAEWLGGRGRVPLWADPVTMAGPIELLAFLREQSISIAAHRHGLVALPAGIEEWIAELDARVAVSA